MSRPPFWRLKRKAENNSKSHPPKINQRTISSFFSNKNEHNENDNPKRPKIEDDNNFVKEPIAGLSTSALNKLKGFSASSQSESTNDANEDASSTGQSDIYASGTGCKTSMPIKAEASLSQSLKDEEDDVEMLEDGSLKLQSLEKLKAFSKSKNNDIELSQKKQTSSKLGKTLPKIKYTPLEEQVLAIRTKHPGVLLFVECGYKYRFFGEDAEIAARELNIYAHMDHNFMVASIPVHRLHAHVNRLVEKGYKVGVVKQTETAALKATSENKSAPFAREMQQVYTRATLIGGEVESIENNSFNLDNGVQAAHVLCINEITDKTTTIAFVAVNPSTGETLYDEFKDSLSREQLFKILQIVKPAEVLTSTRLSEATERLLGRSDARFERIPEEQFEVTSALSRVTNLMASSIGEDMVDGLEKLTDLPPLVLSCMAALVHHLVEFGLDRAVRLDGLHHLSFGSHTLYLDPSTVRNLDLYSSADGVSEGSLFWALNHTKTKFGARLLYKWIAEPIRDVEKIEERQECIGELLNLSNALLKQFQDLLSNLPDLERGLTTILHKKCNPMQYLATVVSLNHVQGTLSTLLSDTDSDFKAPLIRELIMKTINLLSGVEARLNNINQQAAKDGDKTKLLKDFSSFPAVIERMRKVEETTDKLKSLLPGLARTLSVSSIEYFSVSGHEYLIEVKNANSRKVPVQWRKINCTKQASRYRPPEVDDLVSELQRLRDQLKSDCHEAWLSLLDDFSHHYFEYKKAIHNVALLDVYFSLAHIAQQDGFCRPVLFESDDACIDIRQGRHPVVPLLFSSANQYVPNDTDLKSSDECCMVLSGPNMGGKSCYIRQVALIVIMAHIGSYVPAESARISVLRSVHTRMGAKDDLFQGRSTLMVELDEASQILQNISKHSLVLMDELGRGTGTSDGAAIACATLVHLALEVKCLTLFVTHYPSVMTTASEMGTSIANYHMAFILDKSGETEVLTFLYEVTKGAADRSYGINVARLANLDEKLLQRASQVARELEQDAERKRSIREAVVSIFKEPKETIKGDFLQQVLVKL